MVQEAEEHALLQSVVEFGDTLVREVMTPRPDIVAVPSDATLDELRNLFTEQQYSRLPVFEKNLDSVTGFVFVKDLVALGNRPGSDHVVKELLRPAYVVPETKRVAELLKELQRKHVQSAVVHDEYGGTAGLVTIEDLLEEIVDCYFQHRVFSPPISSYILGNSSLLAIRWNHNSVIGILVFPSMKLSKLENQQNV